MKLPVQTKAKSELKRERYERDKIEISADFRGARTCARRAPSRLHRLEELKSRCGNNHL
ncbi:hypothetical protein LINPERHAP2_LOCUS6202, partial [Linum perenne]